MGTGDGVVNGSCLYGASDYVCDWLKNRLPCNPQTAIGIVKGEGLVGAIGYEHYYEEHGDVTISLYSEHPSWFSRQVFTQAFRYPFEILKVHRVTSVVLGNNERALKLNNRLPFIQEGVRRKAYKGEHQHLFRMDESKARNSKWWTDDKPKAQKVVWVYNGDDFSLVRL
jgi:RimJ/RimL family protein N-acetyltransferase